jgi:hypothetical protein
MLVGKPFMRPKEVEGYYSNGSYGMKGSGEGRWTEVAQEQVQWKSS